MGKAAIARPRNVICGLVLLCVVAVILAPLVYRQRAHHSLLHAAVAKSDVRTARVLLTLGFNVDSRDNWGITPLHWAAKRNSSPMVKLLLDRGANVNAKSIKSQTPLHFAETADVARMLLQHGADPDIRTTSEGETPLMEAAYCGNESVARVLLQYGAHPNLRGSGGATPLCIALERGNDNVAQLLRKHGGIARGLVCEP